MPRKLSLAIDYIAKFCFVGLAACAVITIVIAGQSLLKAERRADDASTKTSTAEVAAVATKFARRSARGDDDRSVIAAANDPTSTLSPERDIFGSIPRKVRTIRFGADGKISDAR